MTTVEQEKRRSFLLAMSASDMICLFSLFKNRRRRSSNNPSSNPSSSSACSTSSSWRTKGAESGSEGGGAGAMPLQTTKWAAMAGSSFFLDGQGQGRKGRPLPLFSFAAASSSGSSRIPPPWASPPAAEVPLLGRDAPIGAVHRRREAAAREKGSGLFFLFSKRRPFVVLFSHLLFSLSLYFYYCQKQISKAVFAQVTASTPPPPPPSAEEKEEEDKGAPAPLSFSTLPRAAFALLVAAASDALSKPEKRPFTLSPASFETACGLVERRTPVALLLAGTSGSGKSTLAGLLAARLGGASVVSTDAVRHVLASLFPRESKEAQLLRASTYEAGDLMVEWEREEKERREKRENGEEGAGAGSTARRSGGGASSSSSSLNSFDRAAVIRGYEAQAALVQPAVERIVAAAAARGESVVVEGAHVGIPFAVALASGLNSSPSSSSSSSPADGPFLLHPCACPFLVHISNEQKHAERFAVRAKAMVAINDTRGSWKERGKKGEEKASNSYVAALPRIRAIQGHLRALALRFSVPAVDNTSVDRSVEAVAAAVLACARRVASGGRLVSLERREGTGGTARGVPPVPLSAPVPLPSSDASSASAATTATVLTCRPVAAEFAAATAALWSSKAALGLIRQKREQQRQREQQHGQRQGQQQPWCIKGGERENHNHPYAPSSSSAPSTSAASSPPRPLSELDAFAAAELMSGSRRRRKGRGSRSSGRNAGGGSSGSDGGGEHSPSASDSSGSEGGNGRGGSFSSPSPSPSRAPALLAAAAALAAAPGEQQGDDGAPKAEARSPAAMFPLPLPRPAARALLAAAAAADDGGVSVTEGEDEDEDEDEDDDEDDDERGERS